ncbi:hypothetical protein [Halospeciosus flavus]|uniref:Uncharacterized protein n=1 Tax=Halospeciosus flavus TaxID=3032283 RepID=A0ABD5Z7D5_9EURY|nr:hypothetical protein [Halospeciosus flavus]
MSDSLRDLAGAVETYAVGLAVWYAVMLWFGIPKLPPAGHVVGALSFVGLLAGAGWAAARLDAHERRRTAVRLAALFLVGAFSTSLVVGTTDLTVKQFMKSTLVGKLLIGFVGASLFSGVVLALVTAGRAVVRRRPKLA